MDNNKSLYVVVDVMVRLKVFLFSAFFFIALIKETPLLADEAEYGSSQIPMQKTDKYKINDITNVRKMDIRSGGGPEMVNFSNGAYTLPQGQMYFEFVPVFYTNQFTNNPLRINAPYFLRYGLLDDLEVRLYSTGLTYEGGSTPSLGFSPLVFDAKYHFFGSGGQEYYIPDIGIEGALLTTWLGSPEYTTQGTEPTFSLNFDQTFPGNFSAEFSVGPTRYLNPANGQYSWEYGAQWTMQYDIMENVSVFINGYHNSAAYPRYHAREKQPDVIGSGILWTISSNYTLFCNVGYGVNSNSPPFQMYTGFAWTP